MYANHVNFRVFRSRTDESIVFFCFLSPCSRKTYIFPGDVGAITVRSASLAGMLYMADLASLQTIRLQMVTRQTQTGRQCNMKVASRRRFGPAVRVSGALELTQPFRLSLHLTK